MTTKREIERRIRMNDTLKGLGFTTEECEQLRRISMALHSWHEKECGVDNGVIERDEGTGKPFWLDSRTMRRTPIADRETGALNRLKAIIETRNTRNHIPAHTQIGEVRAYIQTDPRGCALYIIRPGDIPEGETAESCYSRGIAVY